MNNGNKLKRRVQLIILLPIVLALGLLGATIYINGISSQMGVIAVALLILFIVAILIMYFTLLPELSSVLVDYSLEQGKIQKELLHELEIPYAILDTDGHIMWANNMFHDTIGVAHNKRIKKPVDSYFSELLPEIIDGSESVDINVDYNDRKYKASIKRIDMSKVFEEDKDEDKGDDIVLALYLFDETNLRKLEQETIDQKLYAGLLYLDNYDEVMDNLEDVKHSILTALVERKINMYLSNIDAIVKHIENDKYFFVFKQKYMQTLRNDRFSILDDVKNINVGNDIAMTLSIGIGADLDSDNNGYMSAYENARTAIGMAMGRGGDQAAVKLGEQVTYYGGKSAGTEKTTRVKARVKAQAFEELLLAKEKVIIMAHKRPDADAFGSAVGIFRLVSAMNKKAYIVLNEVTDAIRPLVSSFKAANMYDGVFLTSTEAVAQVDQNTVVVVCDVNRPSMTECEELLTLVPTVVVFDHHRQTNEAIKGATLSYIEPFASSACEMIAEMYQYMSKSPKLKSQEADAMYAGILIDTDNFLNKTGVRTFEAASFLRKNGADVVRVRKMFRSSMTELKERAQGISNAEIFMGHFALSYVDADESSKEAPTVPVAKAANELLNVENIDASFVVTVAENGILYVSARSIGDINVQIIMERFNGGGHANIAGAQLEGKTKEEFFDELKSVLKEMTAAGEI
ncbi:MAG: DHH family phosphoesterase [Eubacterium sp.]|jgi:Predicted signaling protein consisting of a modified GGDEF domain and a DHH domain|nr:DHH family phosphoesterase [Eubacterium sp.]